ncbi:hypothetical protein E1B28_009840 [Marasmius oreades]|uniref:MYND-type domain-containing protein n=1 Tax=Marasmius oreades TaxID=181124 RepID=A0A9P7RW42_9AGAR|nr:uncharacterized protein E1B28_009840 [Marasmius oreades]KAG7090750.1 hypothetical protein E1B28_009840 [Marasmius oreades]
MVRSNSSPHSEPEARLSVGMREIKEKARLVGRAPKHFALSNQVLGFLSLLRDVGNHANQWHTEYLVTWVTQDQWKLFFEPWLKSCMEDLIVHPATHSFDMEIARETAMETIPQFLINIVYNNRSMPNLSSDSAHRVVTDLRVLEQIQDPVIELIVTCWETVAEEKFNIIKWGAWSDLVLLVKPELESTTNMRGCTPARAFGALGVNCSGLEHLAREIPRMSSSDLIKVGSILLVLLGRALAANSQGHDITQGWIYSPVHLLRNLLRCRESHEEPHDIELALELVKAVTTLLTAHIQDVGCEGVQAVVDAGILKAFLTAHPSFTSSMLFQPLWADILDTITRFLVYPDVLHRFLQARRKLVKCGLDDCTDTITKPSTPWDWAKLKAFGVRQVRRTMKAEGTLHVCVNHPKCSSGDSLTTFKRCAGCDKVGYCSYACQKSHWKATHRGECRKLCDKWYLTTDNRRFLRCFASTTLSLHTTARAQRIVAYASTMDPTTNEDHERIRMKTANPFLFVNLDLPGLPAAKDFEVLNALDFVDLMSKISEPRSAPFIQGIVAEWRATTIDEVYVFAKFPLTQEDTTISIVGFIWRLDGHIIL